MLPERSVIVILNLAKKKRIETLYTNPHKEILSQHQSVYKYAHGFLVRNTFFDAISNI